MIIGFLLFPDDLLDLRLEEVLLASFLGVLGLVVFLRPFVLACSVGITFSGAGDVGSTGFSTDFSFAGSITGETAGVALSVAGGTVALGATPATLVIIASIADSKMCVSSGASGVSRQPGM